MKAKTTFQPSAAQVAAAETVFTAMALVQMIEPQVRAYQRRILQEGNWPVCSTKADNRIQHGIVLDPKCAFLLSDADFASYDTRCRQEAARLGLVVRERGNCPLLEAEGDLLEARHALVKAMTAPLR